MPQDTDDESCPDGDPTCSSREDECHWACSTFRERETTGEADSFLIAADDGTTLRPTDLGDDERCAVLAAVLADDEVVIPAAQRDSLLALRADAIDLLSASAADEYLDTDNALAILTRVATLLDCLEGVRHD